MNDKNMNFTDIPGAAEAASLAVEQKRREIREEYNRRKIKLIKFGGMALLTSIIMIFATRSWFTMSREVEGTGANMTAEEMPFYIATRDGTAGSDIRYGDLITELTDYKTGDYISIASTDYHKTGSSEKLLLRYTTGESEVGPGGNGSLNLYVIPNVDRKIDVKVTVNVTPYAELTKYDEVINGDEATYVVAYKKDEYGAYILDDEGNQIVDTEMVEIKTQSDFAAKAGTIHNSIAASDAANYVAAAEYLRGHILFFGGTGNMSATSDDDKYYYTTPYTARQFTTTIAANNKDNAVQVPIYWMWTNTLGQIALKDNSSSLLNGISLVSDIVPSGKSENEEKAALLRYLSVNKESVFTNSTEDGFEAALAVPETPANFRLLSEGYNSADHLIGTRIAYFIIDITVEPAD
ncbi:MAG: hypothetical protein K6B18_06525 [Ruminococcus sp.]|nr:hypothetical protein [Ruminococcus sp.]